MITKDTVLIAKEDITSQRQEKVSFQKGKEYTPFKAQGYIEMQGENPTKYHQDIWVFNTDAELLEYFDTKEEVGKNVADHTSKEAVNHPSHYGGENNPYEAIKVIEAWNANFNLGNTLKYIARHNLKGTPLQDLKKAAFYLQAEINKLENL